jgi:MoaA/NifB/PqqE/SkfB family radical SAM enzyme
LTDLLKSIASSFLLDYRSTYGSGVVELTPKMIADISEYCSEAGIRFVCTSANGETTMSSRWHADLAPILDATQCSLQIKSNFSRDFSDADLLSLNKHEKVQIRIDSASPAGMKEQQKIDMRAVLSNAVRLKHLTMKTARKTVLEVTCGVTRANLSQLVDIARLALVLQADAFVLTEMIVDGDNFSVPDGVWTFTSDEAGLFVKSISDAVNALAGSVTVLQIRPGLVAKLQPILAALNERRAVSAESLQWGKAPGPAPGPCLQPWQAVYVLAGGDVRTCSGQRDSLGNIKEQKLIDIVDGPAARDIRAKLLAGESNLPCKTCSASQAVPPSAFNAYVAQSIEQHDAARGLPVVAG